MYKPMFAPRYQYGVPYSLPLFGFSLKQYNADRLSIIVLALYEFNEVIVASATVAVAVAAVESVSWYCLLALAEALHKCLE